MGVHSGKDLRPIIYGAICATSVLCGAVVHANSPGTQLALRQAPSFDVLIAAVDQLPAVVEADALHQAALGRMTQAAARPNPVVGFEGENAFGTGAFKGYGRAETTMSLSQALELWGQRGARMDFARAGLAVVGLQRDQARLSAAARLALAYGEAEAASRRLDLAREALLLVEADAAAATTLVEQGREPVMRRVQAESDVHAARAVVAETQAVGTAALAWLAAVGGLDAPPDTVVPALLDRTPPFAVEPTDESPTVRLAEAERAAAEQAVSVQRQLAKPGVSAGLGLRRLHETRDTALMFAVSVSLPIFDRNRGAIVEALARQQAAAARITGARAESVAQRRAAAATLSASEGRLSAADGAVAAADHAYRLARIGFDAGRTSQMELRTARSMLLAAQTAAVDARLNRVRAEVHMALLDGRFPYRESR